MKTFIGRLLLTATLAALPAAAQQASTGGMLDRLAPRLPADPTKLTTNEAIRIMDQYGQCLVSMQSREADDAISATANPDAVSKAVNEPGVYSCLAATKSGYEVGMAFKLELLRGSVFKALYRQRHRSAQPAFAPQPIDWTPTISGMSSDAAKRFTIFHKIAECALAAAPVPAHQLVMSDYGSDPHKAAFAALAPVIGDCLPEGLQLELPRPSLAGAFAEVAYRKAAPGS